MDQIHEQVMLDEIPASGHEHFNVRPEVRTSAAIQRLLDEVRCDELNGHSAAQGYDRAHNRHNR